MGSLVNPVGRRLVHSVLYTSDCFFINSHSKSSLLINFDKILTSFTHNVVDIIGKIRKFKNYKHYSILTFINYFVKLFGFNQKYCQIDFYLYAHFFYVLELVGFVNDIVKIIRVDNSVLEDSVRHFVFGIRDKLWTKQVLKNRVILLFYKENSKLFESVFKETYGFSFLRYLRYLKKKKK